MKILDILTYDHYYVLPYSFTRLGVTLYGAALIDINSDMTTHIHPRMSQSGAVTVALDTVRAIRLGNADKLNLAWAI